MSLACFCYHKANQSSLTPRWPLTPHLLRSHVWLYPRINVSKSHGNTSMYVDTVINFAKFNQDHYILHTTYRIEWLHRLFLPFCSSLDNLLKICKKCWQFWDGVQNMLIFGKGPSSPLKPTYKWFLFLIGAFVSKRWYMKTRPQAVTQEEYTLYCTLVIIKIHE